MKIGCVPYSHTKPFAGAWEKGEPVWAHPKDLARRLWTGELDLALIPAWEVLMRPGIRVLDGLAIGSHGEVRSVGVFHEKPLAESRSIRLTPHSATSVQLWKLIATHRHLDLPEDPSGEVRLLIGDEALTEWTSRQGRGVLDLGKAWADWTGKPFVYALWALGPKAEIPPQELGWFRDVCLQGIASRGRLARDEAERRYLADCIHYQLGPEEKNGLRLFAEKSGLEQVNLRWI